MKVCKKCKKHVVNKAKICKFCGTDVSKARIIKNNDVNVKKKNNSKVKIQNSKVVNDKVKINVEKRPVLEKKLSVSLDNVYDVTRAIKKVFIDFKNKLSLFKRIPDKVTLLFGRTKKRKCFGIFKTVACVVNGIFRKIGNGFSVVFRFCYDFLNKILSSLDEFRKKLIFKNMVSSRLLITVSVSIVFVFTVSYFGMDIYKNYASADDTVVVGEKATTEKIFSMGDLITYDGVDYKILNVRTSSGNSYKAPKEGNEFLIVTVYIKNNTSEKVPYSYTNWTMSNSQGGEESRIFTSINVDDALYSGELVIGGVKIGSMVFEQPKDDPKLRMNFYELTKDENGDDVINSSKKVFSVSIKVPDEQENKDQITNKDDDKSFDTVKTSDNKN